MLHSYINIKVFIYIYGSYRQYFPILREMIEREKRQTEADPDPNAAFANGIHLFDWTHSSPKPPPSNNCTSSSAEQPPGPAGKKGSAGESDRLLCEFPSSWESVQAVRLSCIDDNTAQPLAKVTESRCASRLPSGGKFTQRRSRERRFACNSGGGGTPNVGRRSWFVGSFVVRPSSVY